VVEKKKPRDIGELQIARQKMAQQREALRQTAQWLQAQKPIEGGQNTNKAIKGLQNANKKKQTQLKQISTDLKRADKERIQREADLEALEQEFRRAGLQRPEDIDESPEEQRFRQLRSERDKQFLMRLVRKRNKKKQPKVLMLKSPKSHIW
jgi:hypothetical protein